ncbi:uncharacterized protein NECHADRAFT_81199 [Fusarium vanettenii 77-13-4]|uniref:DUF6604 domain-containing protein n=1 Tax=Fusarium vanettenii (strain ATCC MYA-4622 / CBS 123669 / FGSC 9596 / NRRL 45880 / 77-13-4) TaxID=660122 RepID=C7ZHN3_FUSV7|nr:uncharacterized protein NECHADRAFT_81199 [Fusarium vanettenii 77-13-4]EEU36521.1 hypothetical protein NECHADRAFT_81199 [Fusarium vanettenii 77-13-4]
MPPDPLVSIYQQYKQGTDFVASWLASTAKSCGYSTGDTAPSVSNTGQEKKNAKRKGKQSAKETTFKTVVAIKDFVPMAKIISSHKPSIKVSQFFLKTLDMVIEMRSGFGKHLAESGVALDKLSDRSHGHFVDVLRQVQEVLQPCCSSPDETASSPDPVVEQITNPFDQLELFEPSQKFLSTQAIPKSEFPIDQNQYEAEVLSSRDDAVAAFTLLVKDLDLIRKSVMGIWLAQVDDRLDLASCAVATNTAFDFARSLIAQVEPDLQEYGGARGVWRLMFEDFNQSGKCTEEYLIEYRNLCARENFYATGFLVYFDPLDMIESFAKEIPPKHDAVVKTGYTGIPSPFKPLESKHSPGKLEHDKEKIAAL